MVVVVVLLVLLLLLLPLCFDGGGVCGLYYIARVAVSLHLQWLQYRCYTLFTVYFWMLYSGMHEVVVCLHVCVRASVRVFRFRFRFCQSPEAMLEYIMPGALYDLTFYKLDFLLATRYKGLMGYEQFCIFVVMFVQGTTSTVDAYCSLNEYSHIIYMYSCVIYTCVHVLYIQQSYTCSYTLGFCFCF